MNDPFSRLYNVNLGDMMKKLMYLTTLVALVLIQQLSAPVAHADEASVAGYEWAEENLIADPADCVGDSVAFIKGCQEYIAEQQEEKDDY